MGGVEIVVHIKSLVESKARIKGKCAHKCACGIPFAFEEFGKCFEIRTNKGFAVFVHTVGE